MDILPNETVRQRKGTNALGCKYEAHLAALYAIKCVLDKNIDNFSIASNLDGYGKFDDIIIDVAYNGNVRRRYLMQLKHKETKRLSTEMLTNPTGPFSLQEYEKSYKDVVTQVDDALAYTDFIILTNAPFEPTPDSASCSLQFTNVSSEMNNFLNTLDDSKVWKIDQRRHENKPGYNQQFLEHLYLFTNQIHEHHIEKMITDLLNVEEKITKLVLNFFDNWVEGKKLKHYVLRKEDVEMKLMDIILGMHTPPLIEEVSSDIKECELFNYVVADYHLTFLSPDQKMNVNNAVTSTVKNHMCRKRETLYQKDEDKRILVRRKGQNCPVDQISESDVYLAMWEKGEIPLMVDCPEEKHFDLVTDTITKFSSFKRKFIIFTNNESATTDFRDYRVFDNLASLRGSKIPRVLERLKLSLQGREPTMHKQLSQSSLLKLCTANVFTTIVLGKVKCGEVISTGDYIIDRHFKKRLVPINIIREVPNSFLVIVNEGDRDMFLKVLTFYDLIQKSHGGDIQWLMKAETSPSQVGNIIHEILNTEEHKSIQHFFLWERDLVADNRVPLFEWVYSRSNCEFISRSLVNIQQDIPALKHFVVGASEALDYYLMPLTIFSNNSGMGKTVTFRHIAKNCSPHIWVVYIDISTNPKSLKYIDDENADITSVLKSFLGASKHPTFANFFRELFKLKLRDNEVLFLIDSYDVEENQADKLIERLGGTGNRIWVSARSCKQQSLEQKYNTISVELTGFNRNEAKTAFEKALSKNRYDWERSETEGVLANLTEELISIPLLVRMLSDIIMKDGKDVFNKKIREIDLYERFMKDSDVRDLLLLRKIALTLFFDEDDLKKVISPWREFEMSRDEMIEKNQRTSILDGFHEKRPLFLHYSYAEYLTATYLADASEGLTVNRDAFRALIKRLFCLRNVNIRKFFDRLLSKNLPLHDAIIHDDIESVTDIVNENNIEALLRETDSYGRTALHLASSYGKFFTFQELNIATAVDIFRVGDVSVVRQRGEAILHQMLEKLHDGTDTGTSALERKDTLGFDVYDFAYECGCLLNLNALYSVTSRSVARYSDNHYFVYHCLRHGLDALLDRTSLGCICHVKCNNEHLISMAVRHCNKDTVSRILEEAHGCSCRPNGTNYTDLIDRYRLLRAACERRDDHSAAVMSVLFERGADRFGGDSPLHRAAELGNVPCVAVLLANNVPLNGTDAAGMTALHRACINDRPACCAALLERNAIFEKGDAAGNTALHAAAEYASGRCLTMLLEWGAHTETANRTGHTPLMVAASRAHGECVAQLLRYKAVVKRRDRRGRTALLVACAGQSQQHDLPMGVKVTFTVHPEAEALRQTVRTLLDGGAPIDDADDAGDTALMLAVKHRKSAVGDLLLERGASVNRANRDGYTALTYAVITENVTYVERFLERDDAPADGKDEGGNTDFMLALRTKNEGIIEALLRHRRLNVDSTNWCGQTTLIVAVQYDLPHLIETLLSRGVPVDHVDDETGHSAIMVSILLGLRGCFDVLMRNGACLGQRTGDGDTALLLAIRVDFYEVVPILLEQRAVAAALNVSSRDGYTALSLSACKGNTAAVERLLNAGASVNRANRDGYTALMFAAEARNDDVVRLLLERGADKYKENNNGENAYQIALKRGHCYALLQC